MLFRVEATSPFLPKECDPCPNRSTHTPVWSVRLHFAPSHGVFSSCPWLPVLKVKVKMSQQVHGALRYLPEQARLLNVPFRSHGLTYRRPPAVSPSVLLPQSKRKRAPTGHLRAGGLLCFPPLGSPQDRPSSFYRHAIPAPMALLGARTANS